MQIHRWTVKSLLHPALGTGLTHVCTAGTRSCLPVSGVGNQPRAGLTATAQDTTPRSHRENSAITLLEFYIPDQSDNLKHLDQVVCVIKKKIKNLGVSTM